MQLVSKGTNGGRRVAAGVQGRTRLLARSGYRDLGTNLTLRKKPQQPSSFGFSSQRTTSRGEYRDPISERNMPWKRKCEESMIRNAMNNSSPRQWVGLSILRFNDM